MKKPIMLLTFGFFAVFAYAQGTVSRFIESPSWVLAENNLSVQQTAAPQGQPAVTTVSVPDAGPVSVFDEPEEPAGSSKSSRNKGDRRRSKYSAPKEEGRWHPGIYFTPMINWTGSIKDLGKKGFKQGGAAISATPALILDVRVFWRLYVGTGLAFNTMGGKIDFPDKVVAVQGGKPGATVTVSHTRSYYFSYMEIPIRVKVKTPNFIGGGGSLYALAAAHVGFGTLYTYYDKYTNIEHLNDEGKYVLGTLSTKGDLSSETKLSNISVVGQIGYQHNFSKHFGLTIGLEYHFGCLNPMSDKLRFNPDYNNHQMGIVLGVIF